METLTLTELIKPGAEGFLLCLIVLTLLRYIVELGSFLCTEQKVLPYKYWIVPAVLIGVFWFIHSL